LERVSFAFFFHYEGLVPSALGPARVLHRAQSPHQSWWRYSGRSCFRPTMTRTGC